MPASARLLPLALPSALLVAGGLVGDAFTLNEPIARERLVGLCAAAGVSLAAMPLFERVQRAALVLVPTAVLGVTGMLLIAAIDSPQPLFRGPIGAPLDAVFRPGFGTIRLSDPVQVTNTRFIVGYNGLADLCLLVIFACVPLWEGARVTARVGLAALITLSLLVLVGSASRGGLDGFVVGAGVVALVAWPRRRTLLALLALPAAAALLAAGLIDKGLELSSTTGRFQYWFDLARLLVEYPLTGVGLGVDTANRVAVQYEINPDPERLFYAHNTFVESYLEQGPLGALGMLLIPLVALLVVIAAKRCGLVAGRRPLLVAGLGLLAGLEAHGLTDQVVTTNLGTLLVLLGLAAMLASLDTAGQRLAAYWLHTAARVGAGVAGLLLVGLLVLPSGRAQVLLDFGGLQMNRGLTLEGERRASTLAGAEALLVGALAQVPDHPAALRGLARVRWARYDDTGALDALEQVAASSRLDAFDTLQIAHLYRDMGFVDQAYAWATRAYSMWGRPPPDAVLRAYAEQTLPDDYRARTLADQAEAAMHARAFGDARSLFQQALTFAPGSAYLQDRLAAAERGMSRQNGG